MFKDHMWSSLWEQRECDKEEKTSVQSRMRGGGGGGGGAQPSSARRSLLTDPPPRCLNSLRASPPRLHGPLLLSVCFCRSSARGGCAALKGLRRQTNSAPFSLTDNLHNDCLLAGESQASSVCFGKDGRAPSAHTHIYRHHN